MNTFIEILIYILDTLGGLFLTFVILRFLLQTARADFYNPFSQAIVKITNPLLIPLRKIIPGMGGIDIASIVLAILTQIAFGELISFIVLQRAFNPAHLFVWGLLGILMVTSYIFLVSILILVVTSFVAPFSSHPILILVRQLTDPLVKPVQKFIPPVGGLDFSVMFVGMVIYILQKVTVAMAVSVGLFPALVIGF